MKNLIAFSLIICLSLLFSCGALKHIVFYEEFHESGTIPQKPLTSATDTFISPAVPTNIEQQMKANNTSTDLVQSVKLQTLTLTIKAPPGQTFAALNDVRIFILTDSLPAIEIAYKHNIVSTSDTLNLDIDGTELKPYLITNSFKMEFITSNKQAVTTTMTLDVYMKFRFEANLLAAL